MVLIISKNSDSTRSKGTGSIIGDGLVLTNAHVVLDNFGEHASRIFIYLKKDNLNDDSQRAYKKGRKEELLNLTLSWTLQFYKLNEYLG